MQIVHIVSRYFRIPNIRRADLKLKIWLLRRNPSRLFAKRSHRLISPSNRNLPRLAVKAMCNCYLFLWRSRPWVLICTTDGFEIAISEFRLVVQKWSHCRLRARKKSKPTEAPLRAAALQWIRKSSWLRKRVNLVNRLLNKATASSMKAKTVRRV